MKVKKVLIVVLLLSIWSGTLMFASAASQKVKVVMNGSSLGEIGYIMEGSTFLPLRKLGESLQAIVEWDNNNRKTVIYKPNVHMFVYNISGNGESTFGAVDKGFSGKIKVFAQVDNVAFDLKATKISIADPSGRETVLQSLNVNDKKDNYWFVTEEMDYKFSSSGKYTIKFYMKTDNTNDWVVTSEKVINSN